jgi:hypothetical protein
MLVSLGLNLFVTCTLHVLCLQSAQNLIRCCGAWRLRKVDFVTLKEMSTNWNYTYLNQLYNISKTALFRFKIKRYFWKGYWLQK